MWDEGFDPEKNKYVGLKWGKYIRAPDIFFKILIRERNNLVLLKNKAEVRRGYIPWPYEVFRLTKEDISKYKISNYYFKETFSSPTECRKIIIDSMTKFPYHLLVINTPLSKIRDKNLRHYLKKMSDRVERSKNNPDNWFQLQERDPWKIVWPRTPYNRHIVFLNEKGVSVIDHVEINPKIENAKTMCAILNSTVYILFREIYGRTGLGGGTLKSEVMDIKNIPYPNNIEETIKNKVVSAFNKLSKRI